MRRAAVPSGIATIVVAGAALADVVGALVGPRGGPVTIATDCSRPGDHCLVRADLAVP